MENFNTQLQILEQLEESHSETSVIELSMTHLAIVGGGVGEVIFG